MYRKARSLFLPLTLGLVLSTPFVGCRQTGGNSGGKGGSGGSGGGSGGTTVKGGAGGNSVGSGGTSGGSGGTSGGSGGSGSGGTTAKGGSGGTSSGSGGSGSGGTTVKGGSGGTSVGSGGTTVGSGGNTVGSGGNTVGSGGNTVGSGGSSGSGTGGVTGGGGSTSTAPPDMISDFEDNPGNATMDPNGGRTGYWYVYFPGSDSNTAPSAGMTISPALNNGKPVLTAKDGSNNALHFTGSGYGGTSNNYAGAGASFKPHTWPDKVSDAYDASKYTGISFKIKSGTGTPAALYVEMLAKESQPTTAGGTASNQYIDLYNTRGQMIVTPWTANAISSSWQTVNVPFGTLIPRWLPAAGSSNACPAAGSGIPKCQAAPFVPANALGIQMSFYRDSGWPSVSGSTAGTFDIWIDDVAFTTDDSGLQKQSGFPLSGSGSWGSCIKPSTVSASAKYLVPAYNMWKATFVKGSKVIRPENQNDTVSEGIAYGMMIAANMNDKALFDSLYSTWTGNPNDKGATLMNWCLGSGGGSAGTACSTSGGSATDADEDAAFALLEAATVFKDSSYKTKAMTMIGDIWANDIDKTSKLPTGGSHYSTTSGSVTNPSYFAPSFYTAFKAAGDSNDWASVNTAVYGVIGGSLAGSNGLFAAWCSSNCTSVGSNGGANDGDYQYDSHRIPMRIGLDYCWNGTGAAQTYAKKITSFFSTQAKDGVGRVPDMFTPSGGAVSGTAPNSASILGTAAVAAMAAGDQTFLDAAFQLVFDSCTRSTLAVTDSSGKTPYSYFNATVGLLTLLMMTGNFVH